MIDVKIISKPKNEGSTSAVNTGSTAYGSMAVKEAAHAAKADIAETAKEAEHASKADQALEANHALVAETVKGGIEKAKEADHAKEADNSKQWSGHEFSDWLDQPVKKSDAVAFASVTSDDMHSSDSDGNTSMTGKGWTLKNVIDETGSYSVLAVDNIVVRKKLEAAELEIHKKTYVGAQMIASDWGHKILRVDPIYFDYASGEASTIGLTLFTLPVTVDGVRRMVAFVGKELTATDTRVELLGDGKGLLNKELEQVSNAFKVYFCESDGTASIKDDLVVGAMGQCQEFNVTDRVTHNFTNSYYWGVCVKHGVEDNVQIGGHSMRCVYGIFAHTTEKITLTTEAPGHEGKTFTCYGMENAGCTFPVAGDDMVGFGCADPWQDADRCNAIVIASKDGEKSAPSVIAYSGIGRMRGGSILETPKEDITVPDYIDIKEQYSLPSEKDDSRLDFRVSRRAGNVFKGDLYFKGDDNTIKPVGESYMLSADKSVVENGGKLSVTIYRVNGSKVVAIKAEEVKEKNFSVWLYRDNNTNKEVTSTYEDLNWNDLTGDKNDIKSVTLHLLHGNDVLYTISVSLGEKSLPRTEVWRLVPVQEIAESNYEINGDEYGNYAEKGETGDDTINNIFVKSTEINLQYYIVYQQGTSSPIIYTKVPAGKVFSVSAFTDNEATVYSYSSNNETGTVVDDKIQNLRFSDRSDTNAKVSTIKRIAVQLFDKNSQILDQRMVIPQLGTNSVADMNKDFLAYIYYGTDGKGGMQYTNQRVTNMKGTVETLTSRMDTAEDGIKENKTNITKTAEGLDAEVSARKTTDNKLNGLDEDMSKISQRATEISTRVTSLYTEGNLLWGGDVRGMVKKQYGVFTSERVSVKKGLSYTVAARMWLVAKKDYPTQPAMDGHVIHLYVFKPDWSWQKSQVFSYTRAGTVIDYLMFTAEEDMDVQIGIYEQGDKGDDAKAYGGVAVDWVRMDMGNQKQTSWSAAAKDVEAQNLIPDVNFDDSTWKRTQPDGATREPVNEEIKDFNDSGLLSVYNDDYSYYGFRGVRLRRSGCRTTSDNGLRYYIPFRGEGDYTLAAMVKDLNGVTLDEGVWIQMYPCGEDKKRNGSGSMFSLGSGNATGGYIPLSVTRRFADSETNSSGALVKTFWIEVRVLLLQNGDVVVSRMSLARNSTAIHWNANALGDTASRQQALESYTQQRAGSIEAGIRQGLKSVGFRMDSANWTVNTWGNKFAWYATEADANKGTNAKMWLDTNTGTLHVKGYVEATGGKIGNLELVSDGDATFERSKDSSGKYIEKSRSVMSSRSITFYEQHSDGRFFIVEPVSWLIKIQSDADHPGKGLQSVKMEGYSYMFPGHSVELGDNTTPTNWAKMTGMGIGYSTNGRAIAKVFQSGTGGLAMVCVAYGTIKADGTFKAEDQTQMALDYNCTVERVNKKGTGWYECTLHQTPHGLYTVFVRARVSSGGNVMYATLGAVSVYTFTVMTSDDSTRNDCDFEYFVVSFGGY